MKWMQKGSLGLLALSVAITAEARPVDREEAAVCNWGGGMASLAQTNYLQGKSLAQFESALQRGDYPKPWMPEMASGIAEITYGLKSRNTPDKVEKDYVHDCIQHVLAN